MKNIFLTVKDMLGLLEELPSLSFMLPSGELIPAHFHITEVGRVQKDFIDCGGTTRQSISCLLQVWTSHDVEHRLSAGKLASILKLAEKVLGSDDLPIEIEYGADVAAQYMITDIQMQDGNLMFYLGGKKTDCLAPDKCGVNRCKSSGCC